MQSADNKFYLMKNSFRSKDRYEGEYRRRSKKKEILVEPERLELDEYMLKQIKRSKHSVKKLTKYFPIYAGKSKA